jgi:DNA-binding transcriptional ArsR family regulator
LEESVAAAVFKALGDPVRWSIIAQMAAVDELACADLERTLPVSKPTISYHTRILQQAGLLLVRKAGRNYFYTLHREVLRDVQDELSRLAQIPLTVVEDGTPGVTQPAQRSAGRSLAPLVNGTRRKWPKRRSAGDDEEVDLPTW